MYSGRFLKGIPLTRYYSLIFSIAISDLKLHYKNSFLGFIWTFLQPLLFLGVLNIVFSTFLGSKIPHFPLYLLIGLILWNSFSRTTSTSMMSFVSMRDLLSKVYFPREILPISTNITSFIMMSFDLCAFGVFVALFNFIPPWTIVYFPILLITLFILTLGLSFMLSVANVYFRDLEHIWGIVLQAGFFLAPVFLSMDLYPPPVRQILIFNPITLMIDMAHNIVLYGHLPSIGAFGYLAVTSLAILGLGYMVFKKFESKAIEIL
jgi:homopolymeric O-antigen transport system permease protein